MPGREPLPEGTTIEDVIDAITAAWFAKSREGRALIRDLIEQYVDVDVDTVAVCLRPQCKKIVKNPRWRSGHGIWTWCPHCSARAIGAPSYAAVLESYAAAPRRTANARP